MEVPHLNKYDSLVEKVLRSHDQSFPNYTYNNNPFQPNMKELLNNIEEINMSKSFSMQPLRETHIAITTKSNPSSEETLSLADSRTLKSQKTSNKAQPRRSLIFTSQKFIKNKHRSPYSSQKLTVYFFDLPVHKKIRYEKTTTIADLIFEAIEQYLGDESLDHTKIRQRNINNYEMRLLASEEGFKADMTLPAINYERLVSENIFDCLVLRTKDKKERKYSEAEPFKFLNKTTKRPLVSINLYNQIGEQLGTLSMNHNDSLEKIFSHVQTNDLHNMRSYYLAQSRNDTDSLPQDFEVKNLESNKIYIKAKRYIDEADYEIKARSLRNISLIIKEPEASLEMPIGLNEASQYEEFEVIKINPMGFDQERILGIDQTKIYNYDKNYRYQKRETGFFSKLMGINEETGTKKPFRLVADVVSLKKSETGLVVTFKEKPITYIVKDGDVRDRLFRKLNFLVNHSCKQEKFSTPKGKI